MQAIFSVDATMNGFRAEYNSLCDDFKNSLVEKVNFCIKNILLTDKSQSFGSLHDLLTNLMSLKKLPSFNCHFESSSPGDDTLHILYYLIYSVILYYIILYFTSNCILYHTIVYRYILYHTIIYRYIYDITYRQIGWTIYAHSFRRMPRRSCSIIQER